MNDQCQTVGGGTYWDSVRNTGNVFVSVKFYAEPGVEDVNKTLKFPN